MTQARIPHIFVTGASRGIGAAALTALEAAGAKVCGHATEKSETIAVGADLNKPGGGRRAWRAALGKLDGRIDVVVNNAGIFEALPLETDEADWLAQLKRTLRINLLASAEISRLAVLHFQEQGGGRIVNIASRAAYRGDSPDHWHYAASKGGLVAMTKTIARGYAAENILAFAICPGFTMTGMADDYLESRGGEKLLADIPLGRVAQPEEIASMIAYCALEAPASMTGAVLDANGASFVR